MVGKNSYRFATNCKWKNCGKLRKIHRGFQWQIHTKLKPKIIFSSRKLQKMLYYKFPLIYLIMLLKIQTTYYKHTRTALSTAFENQILTSLRNKLLLIIFFIIITYYYFYK